MAQKAINIINVSSDVGSIYAGKSRAPAAFKATGLQEKLKAGGSHVTESHAFRDSSIGWAASTRSPNGARNESRTVEACHQVCDAVAAALGNEPAFPFQLILSGECLLAGTSKSVGIVYMDADCDLYTPAEPGASGNIAGMTLTHMTMRDGALQSMKTFCRPDGSGVVDNSNIVLFGLNANSEANTRTHLGYLFDNNFRVVTSHAVQGAPQKNAQAALQWLEERVDYIVIHLDVDVIDPGEFPLCNVPNWTGLGFEETMAALKVFLKSEKTVALSVAEVNPDHDPQLEMTGRLVDQIVNGLR
ncbi:Arginase/deacetylase [Polyplosphaeria fusca]|uniref:Arginase/deacetylase n=1 Tax=Polyplosphaeria fusca TaxID=682080 RepID=A0A9P4USR7_9PLEO|nr:Arginase/deacetylase [Polyplosphaeria fusca]